MRVDMPPICLIFVDYSAFSDIVSVNMADNFVL